MTSVGLVFPEKLEIDPSSKETYGKFTVEPFQKGYGHTVGHALWRILRSSLEGAAVTAVRIKGAPHEFSSLKGVREDAITLLLNLRRLRFRLHTPGPDTFTLRKKGGEVKGKHIDTGAAADLMNPDHVIANIDAGAEIDMEIEVSRGRGYMPAERLKREGHPVNTIPLDALFSPVSRVQYEVQNARVGQMTDYDKLIIEIWTDGSITPEGALREAARILRESVEVFVPPVPVPGDTAMPGDPAREATGPLKDLVNQPVDVIELSARASNCLKAAKITTIGELVSKSELELMNFKNFGTKSLVEIKERLKEMNLHLGMLTLSGNRP